LRVGPQDQRQSRFRFVHSLYQKYLYTRLDAVRRAYLHERCGNALEEFYGDAAAEIAVQLAWHFEQAGLVEKAVHYRHSAGDRAWSLGAVDEAIDHYARGLSNLALAPHSPERGKQERALQIALVTPLNIARGLGNPATHRALLRAYELCQVEGEQ